MMVFEFIEVESFGQYRLLCQSHEKKESHCFCYWIQGACKLTDKRHKEKAFLAARKSIATALEKGGVKERIVFGKTGSGPIKIEVMEA